MAQKSELQNQQNVHMNDLKSCYYCICTVKNTLTNYFTVRLRLIFNSPTETAHVAASGDSSQHRERFYELPMDACQVPPLSFPIRNWEPLPISKEKPYRRRGWLVAWRSWEVKDQFKA